MENTILNLDETDKIKGQIYLITNIETNKCYIGQVRSHRKNREKYRPFGYIGRFNDHVSEAINNTKKKQCTYLNNAIRKYGKEKFKVELLETCDTSIIDEREQFYINEKNTLFPNGYNLTKGGKNFYCENDIENNQEFNTPKKRGRDFGYKHTESTIKKMKERLTNKTLIDAKKSTMKDTMSKFYDNKKIDILSSYELDEDVSKYIRPVINKETNEIHDYLIRLNRNKKLTVKTQNESLDKKYDRLFSILNKAKEERDKKNQQNNEEKDLKPIKKKKEKL
jgi:hypothetical protein